MHYGRTNRQIIMALAAVLDYEEDLKLYHAWRAGLLAGKIAELLPHMRQQLFYAGLLHDIGGVGLPDHLVHYSLGESRTAEGVSQQIYRHPALGAEIIALLPGFSQAAAMVATIMNITMAPGILREKRAGQYPG